MEPAARHVQRVAGAQRELEHGRAGLAERRRPALRLQRQLEHRVVHAPVLLAGDLKDEDVVRVVVDGEALRAPRRVVRVRLHGLLELRLQLPAEARERRPVEVEALEDDRRAALECRRDRVRVDHAREGLRPPREIGRVVGLGDRAAFANQPQRRCTQAAGGDQPLDVRDREQVVETTRLGARDGERLLLPVLREELRCVESARRSGPARR